ncbi:DUF2508 family protein [Paenibacillus larvae]|uniref:DUF2508 domain-containing protein n=4 Tax=Paenibacillus larvae TaxID=1464 RepID=V9W965_9BACL|nr:DUF2508 family protein [Paenibacillus larvae]AHD07576.1 hypothetical protein ERIC2_c38900 [Paenibacillus larvae subsp. larvae DSM 25430]AQR78553.1 DUF2508 domain-containing protein [Paenibacillus larvae subsp. larvae]AQT84831.1 DUF2508 domain-containing protein [Paenibacillus larvae subsp. pulvifaciens]AQZ46824.1 DUF2508 domain-containing protein [Paenibacillus larvae subsp. pulvifaciens]ARF68217.1 DUF2508 domain-containing protein [Paenibacillus larvae subsp. pulvifaciens]
MLAWITTPKKAGKRNSYADQLDKLQLITDLKQAQAEWKNACLQFEYAKEEEEIDYAISVMEAAERKYTMLLRRAKRHNVNAY